MILYSPSVNLAWQFAALEAARAGLKFIGIEPMLIGVLKVGDILDPNVRQMAGLELSQVDLLILEHELASLNQLLGDFSLDRVELRRAIRRYIEPKNHAHPDGLVHRSESCKSCFKQAEEIAGKQHAMALRPLHLFAALVEQPTTIMQQALADFEVDLRALQQAAVQGSERESVLAGGAEQQGNGKRKSATPSLDRYGTDLTRLAAEGKIEPMIGRREELLQMIRTLTRKTKNNPVLVGEPGVGKTAIARGLALRIAKKNITPLLRDKRIIEISLAGLVAGTKYRGEFEERILNVIEEARRHSEVILFIDEFHTLLGAGRAEGAMDAANIMKPALATGEIRCIGATTRSEYRRYIEKDAALERRLQPITVPEPSEAETLEILMGLQKSFEDHHQVLIMPGVLDAAVKLAVRYLPERQLPDKAIDLIDEACCRIKVDRLSFYGTIEELRAKSGFVTAETVASVLADWTGRPVEAINAQEQEKLTGMEGALKSRVIGQDHAVAKVVQMIKTARAGLRDPAKPTGVFLFLGPTGVGKTELARAVAEYLFDSPTTLIRMDMSEYMERHSVAKLIGAPPGYVGYEEEGQLTGRLRSKPYSVVLLDEIEKAHPEVLNLFLQVFDEGRLTDAKGKTVDARSAVFIMTSNLGTQQLHKPSIGFGVDKGDEPQQNLLALLKMQMQPEFLNRIDEIIVFKSLEFEDMGKIVQGMLEKLKSRLKSQGI
ncbi:MAG: ATP-dependent Clp protease ATP-binding subunit, partial [bacterium]